MQIYLNTTSLFITYPIHKHTVQNGKNKNTSKEEQEKIKTNRKAFSNWAIQKFTDLHPILQKIKNQQKIKLKLLSQNTKMKELKKKKKKKKKKRSIGSN